MAKPDPKELWAGPYLRDFFQSIESAGGSVEFDQGTLQLLGPQSSVRCTFVLEGDTVACTSTVEDIDASSIELETFLQNLDIICSKVLQEIDGIDRGV
jgi:hypothetical protein